MWLGLYIDQGDLKQEQLAFVTDSRDGNVASDLVPGTSEPGRPPSTEWPPLARCPGLVTKQPCSACWPSPPLDWVTHQPHTHHSPPYPTRYPPLTTTTPATPKTSTFLHFPNSPSTQAWAPQTWLTPPAVRGRLLGVSPSTWLVTTQRELKN